MLMAAPVNLNFYWGQSQLIILALMVAAMRAMDRNRDGTAGLIIAIAALLRAYPLLLVGYFIFRRKWRAVMFATAGIAAGGFATVAILGLSHTLSFVHGAIWLRAFSRFMVPPPTEFQIAFPWVARALEETSFIALLTGYVAAYWFATDDALLFPSPEQGVEKYRKADFTTHLLISTDPNDRLRFEVSSKIGHPEPFSTPCRGKGNRRFRSESRCPIPLTPFPYRKGGTAAGDGCGRLFPSSLSRIGKAELKQKVLRCLIPLTPFPNRKGGTEVESAAVIYSHHPFPVKGRERAAEAGGR